MSCRAIKRRSDPVAAALQTPPSQTKLCGSQSCWGTPCFAKQIDMERGRDKNAGQESNQDPIECVALTEHHKLPALGGKRRPDEFADVGKHFWRRLFTRSLLLRVRNTTVITESPCYMRDTRFRQHHRAEGKPSSTKTNPLSGPGRKRDLNHGQGRRKEAAQQGQDVLAAGARGFSPVICLARMHPSRPLPLCKQAHASGKRNDGLLLFRPLHCELNVDFFLDWGVW